MAEQQDLEMEVPVMDDTSAVTVETPSRLLLFHSSSLCKNISAYLPKDIIKRPIGNKVTIGRSSNSDVRLNDERMSRTYAEIWHDGRDPFVFKIRNISDRKYVMVGEDVLRCGEQCSLKDGCLIKLDLVEFEAKIYPGDFNSSTFEMSFIVRNEKFDNCFQSNSEFSAEPTHTVAAHGSQSLLQTLRSRQNSNSLDSVFIGGNMSSSTGRQCQSQDQQVPDTPVNDLDSGFVLDTTGAYRPNIPSTGSLRGSPRCQSCQNVVPSNDREVVYSRSRLSPCENSDVVNDGTADDNDVM